MKNTNNSTPVLAQILIISIITLISQFIESIVPFPLPASVIGLVLMFVALSAGIIKLKHVEKVGTALTDNISLLFVPSGISVMNSFGILGQNPVLILALIIISTILLLAVTGKATQLIMNFNPRTIKVNTKGILSGIKGRKSTSVNAEGRA